MQPHFRRGYITKDNSISTAEIMLKHFLILMKALY